MQPFSIKQYYTVVKTMNTLLCQLLVPAKLSHDIGVMLVINHWSFGKTYPMSSCKNVPSQSTKHTSWLDPSFCWEPSEDLPKYWRNANCIYHSVETTNTIAYLINKYPFLVLCFHPCSKLTTIIHLCFHNNHMHILLIPSREEGRILSRLEVRRK